MVGLVFFYFKFGGDAGSDAAADRANGFGPCATRPTRRDERRRPKTARRNEQTESLVDTEEARPGASTDSDEEEEKAPKVVPLRKAKGAAKGSAPKKGTKPKKRASGKS